jgi:hypothetical protein
MTSTALAINLPEMLAIEEVVCTGDLKGLTSEQRVIWYKSRCDAAGLDYRSEPFIYVILNGKLKLYPTALATQQVCQREGISTQIIETKLTDDYVMMKCRAVNKTNVFTERIAMVWLKGLSAEAYCNAVMKCETKAARRTVLALTGLASADEDDVEDIPGARIASRTAVATAISAAPLVLTAATHVEDDLKPRRLAALKRWNADPPKEESLLPRILQRPLSDSYTDPKGKVVSCVNATFKTMTAEELLKLEHFLNTGEIPTDAEVDDDDDDADEHGRPEEA